MDYAVVISAIVLGLSVLATAAKFLDWFLHSDPKTMVRTVRWMLLLLIIIGVPLLIMMLLREQWVGAMLLGAGMLIVGTFLKWRAILGPLNTLFSHFRPKPRPFEMPPVWEEEEETATDPKAVARAAAILEAYVRQTAPNALPAEVRRLSHVAHDDDEDEDNVSNITVKEALEVLGLPDGAVIADVHTAHRRLMRMADPDEGGSPYLAAKIDQARDVLIDVLRRRTKPAAIGSAAPKRLPKN